MKNGIKMLFGVLTNCLFIFSILFMDLSLFDCYKRFVYISPVTYFNPFVIINNCEKRQKVVFHLNSKNFNVLWTICWILFVINNAQNTPTRACEFRLDIQVCTVAITSIFLREKQQKNADASHAVVVIFLWQKRTCAVQSKDCAIW